MTRSQRLGLTLAASLLLALACFVRDAAPLFWIDTAEAQDRAQAAAARVAPRLRRELSEAKLRFGATPFIRIFKLENELELWLAGDDGYRLFRRYPICAWSGELGPKLRQGDGQAPEGFYRVRRGQMNPASRYHLSFNLGYPNAYDRQHGRTGDYLMVHGNCVSIGCYAMGDAAIEEIYTLMGAAFDAGTRAVEVHAFPFRFDRPDLEQRLADPQWGEFWRELKTGFDAFEHNAQPPEIAVVHGHYRVVAPP
jgi:murein L,D-transpeptidase YafK